MRFLGSLNLYTGPKLFFFLLGLVFVLPQIFLGPFSYIELFDNADSVVSRYMIVAQNVAENGFPYWFPYASGGVDTLTNLVGLFDFNLFLFLIFPDWLVVPLQLLLASFCGGFFTYLFAREKWGVSSAMALFAGALFVLTQKMIFYQSLGLGLMPVVIYFLDKIFTLESRYLRQLLYSVLLGLAYSLCSNFILTGFYTYPVVVVFLMFVCGHYSPRKLSIFLGFGVALIALQWPTLWALSDNIAFSHKALIEPLPQELNLKSYLAAEFLGLVLMTCFIVLLSVRAAEQNKCISILAALVFMSSTIFYQNAYLKQFFVPVLPDFIEGVNFKRFVPPLLAMQVLVFAGVLVKIGDNIKRRTQLLLAVILLCFAVSPVSKLFLDQPLGWLQNGSYYGLYHSHGLRDLSYKIQRDHPDDVPRTVFVARTLEPAILNTYGLETADGYTNLYPHAYFQLWQNMVDRQMIPANVNEHYLDFDPEEYGEEKGVHIDDDYNHFLASLLGIRYFVSQFRLDSDILKPVDIGANNDQIWQNLSAKDKLLYNLSENFKGKNYYIYENKEAFPRWFLISESLYSDQLQDFPAGFSGVPVIGAIQKTEYTSDRIVLSVSANEDSVLVITNNYNKNWKCVFQNTGRSCTIEKAFGLFWGVQIPKGEQTLTFSYAPPYRGFGIF